MASTFSQFLFYLFAFIVYGNGNQSKFLIVFVAIAVAFFLVSGLFGYTCWILSVVWPGRSTTHGLSPCCVLQYNLVYAGQALKGEPWLYRAW